MAKPPFTVPRSGRFIEKAAPRTPERVRQPLAQLAKESGLLVLLG